MEEHSLEPSVDDDTTLKPASETPGIGQIFPSRDGLISLILLLLVNHPPLTVVELFARRQEKLSDKKEKIAELASGLIEDPETNVS